MRLTHPTGNKGVKLPYQRQQETGMVHRSADTMANSSRIFWLLLGAPYATKSTYGTLWYPVLFPVRYVLSNYLLLKRKTSVVNYKESAWLKPAGRQNLTPSYCLQGKDEIIVSRPAVFNLWVKSS